MCLYCCPKGLCPNIFPHTWDASPIKSNNLWAINCGQLPNLVFLTREEPEGACPDLVAFLPADPVSSRTCHDDPLLGQSSLHLAHAHALPVFPSYNRLGSHPGASSGARSSVTSTSVLNKAKDRDHLTTSFLLPRREAIGSHLSTVVSTLRAKAGRMRVQGKPGLHREILAGRTWVQGKLGLNREVIADRMWAQGKPGLYREVKC